MKDKKKEITRIINAREVFIDKDKKMRLRTLGFDMDTAYLAGGPTVVEIKHKFPQYYSSSDCACLWEKNYFVGEITVNWQPGIYQKRDSYNSASQQRCVINQVEDGFFTYLPSATRSKELFEKVVKNKKKIRKWIDLWYKSEGAFFSLAMSLNGNRDNATKMQEQMEKIHEELISKGLTEHDGTIINPQYMFVITNQKVKKACYNHSKSGGSRLGHSYKTFKRLNLQWITPNVCLADNEEDFFELMKECYGITEISE